MLPRPLLALVLLPSLAVAVPAEPSKAAAPGSSFRCPARGGPAWRAVRSAHLELLTDLPDAAADALARELEVIWSVQVRALVGGDAEIPGRVRVVALAQGALYQQLFGEDGGARALPGYFGEPTVVLSAARGPAALQAAAGALASHLSWFVYPRQAAWYHVGLSAFLASAALPVEVPPAPGQKRAPPVVRDVGLTTPALRAGLARLAPVPARELLAWSGQRPEGEGWERQPLWSWALYRHLRTARPAQLRQLEARLAEGDEPAAAWRAAFPDLDPADARAMEGLDAALAREAKVGDRGYFRAVAAPVARLTRARLPSAEVHALLLTLRQRWPAGEAAEALARAELQETLKEDPYQPLALARLTALDQRPAVVALRAAVRKGAARDGRAWLLLGGALDPVAEAAEREAALRRAAQLAPDLARAQDALARHLLTAKRPQEALPFANRAVDLAPADPAALDGLAQVVDALGHCREALVLERRAVERLGAAPPEPLQQRVEALRARCGG